MLRLPGELGYVYVSLGMSTESRQLDPHSEAIEALAPCLCMICAEGYRHMYIYIYRYLHICTFISMYPHTYTYIHIQMYMYMYICIYVLHKAHKQTYTSLPVVTAYSVLQASFKMLGPSRYERASRWDLAVGLVSRRCLDL